jgi:YD repeat-containing protein
VTEKQLPDGQRVTYQYDLPGNLVQADDGVFPVRYSYDPAGRLIRVEYLALKKTVSYEYEALGLRTRLIDAEGRDIRYEYNVLGSGSASPTMYRIGSKRSPIRMALLDAGHTTPPGGLSRSAMRISTAPL